MNFPTFSPDTSLYKMLAKTFIGKEIHLSQQSALTFEELPLDLRIANYTICIFGDITTAVVAPLLFFASITYGFSLLRNRLLLPITDPEDLISLAETVYVLAKMTWVLKVGLITGAVTSTIFCAAVAYRRYFHPEFYIRD